MGGKCLLMARSCQPATCGYTVAIKSGHGTSVDIYGVSWSVRLMPDRWTHAQFQASRQWLTGQRPLTGLTCGLECLSLKTHWPRFRLLWKAQKLPCQSPWTWPGIYIFSLLCNVIRSFRCHQTLRGSKCVIASWRHKRSQTSDTRLSLNLADRHGRLSLRSIDCSHRTTRLRCAV